MTASTVSLFATAVVLFAALSGWLGRRQVSGPMVFTALGAALGLSAVAVHPAVPVVQALTQTALALILFHDAAQVRPGELRREAGLCSRLLLLGLPLTVLAGLAAGLLLFPTGTGWSCLFIASALAPTDAGLGAPTVLNPAVPARIRRILNVESGLNDGLVTPVVLLAVGALALPGVSDESHLLTALKEVGIGALSGIASGAVAGTVLLRAGRRGLAEPGTVPPAGLVVPLLAYYGATATGGNGFVAAFLAGAAFAATHRPSHGAETASTTAGVAAQDDPAVQVTEPLSTVLEFAAWTLFGALAAPHLPQHLTWHSLAFAVLSLTVLRMGPVAIALAGTRLRGRTVLFMGWFGPRGLASVIFALIAVQSLPPDPQREAMLATVELTVLLSVVLHGATAAPGARRYGAWARLRRPAVELAP